MLVNDLLLMMELKVDLMSIFWREIFDNVWNSSMDEEPL